MEITNVVLFEHSSPKAPNALAGPGVKDPSLETMLPEYLKQSKFMPPLHDNWAKFKYFQGKKGEIGIHLYLCFPVYSNCTFFKRP